MAYETIITERQDGHAIIRLNRPKALNALRSRAMDRVVDRGGFEPPTPAFSVLCSTN